MIAEFGSLGAVLAGADSRRARAAAGDEAALDDLRWFRRSMLSALHSRLDQGPLLNNRAALNDFLRADMGHAPIESFRAFYLDATNQLIRDEVLSTGTIDRAPLFPRELIARAFELGAAGLVLVHNHPSGDASPSDEDISSTRQLAQICASLGIAMHDHIIVGRTEVTSLRAAGVLTS